MVARDIGRAVVMAKACTVINDWDPELAEATVSKLAIAAATEFEWKYIQVEGDSQLVIKALQKKAQRNSYVQLAVDDALASCSLFDHVSFIFCYRECNEVAHRLARWAAVSFCDELWFGECPAWLYDVVVSDVSSLT